MAFHEITGTDLADRIDGTVHRDLILAGGGNDTLGGWAGNDREYGEAGNDLIFGSIGNDTLFGGDGDDELHSNQYDTGNTDYVYGGTGNDRLFAEDRVDYSYAGAGDDLMTVYFDVGGEAAGGAGTDTLWMNYIGSSLNVDGVNYDASVTLRGPDAGASAGPDSMILSGFEVLHITTYMGDDTVQGGNLADYIDVFTGADVVRALGGDDVVKYRTGQAASLDGGAGQDTLYVQGIESSPALTVVVTGTGATDGLGSVMTGFEHWYVQGSALEDYARLGAAQDRFRGYAGDDVAYGRGGHDLIHGGGGSDQLFGGAGQDVLSGGRDTDTLEGGTGADRFVFTKAAVFGDVISDFVSGQDSIHIAAGALDGLLPVGAVAQFTVDEAAGQGAQFVWIAATGSLYFDANGTDEGGAVLVATLTGSPPLTAADLVVDL